MLAEAEGSAGAVYEAQFLTAGCTGMQRVSRGDNYIILPSRLTPIDQFGRAQHFAMKLGAIKNNYLIGLSWLARSTLLSTASAHNSDIHGERRPRLMHNGALPKHQKTPERTFPSWYTLNIVADDELAWLENVDSGSLGQRPGCIIYGLSRETVIYHSPKYCWLDAPAHLSSWLAQVCPLFVIAVLLKVE
ncbi:hypothetical protein B0H14DRAFT_2579233 [Mycena olivaceomarginata]|nr:hypothetical protein B0H14DRAFT_2579233 [Mycena olivaceomarginata]